MSTSFAILSLLVAGYRIRKGLFTRPEWALLSFWALHLVLEFLQLFFDLKSYHFEIRFFQPADFLVFGWLAWGVVTWWRRVRWLAVAAVAAVAVYNAVMLVKAQLPVGRRAAYAAACEWAASRIRADWHGPARDAECAFSIKEYHLPNRPVVDAHSARVPYLVGGRLDMAEAVFKDVDVPDYWIQDIASEDPPKSGYELVDVFRRGRYELHLYRRGKADE